MTRNRWWIALLIISLLANGVLLGLIIGYRTVGQERQAMAGFSRQMFVGSAEHIPELHEAMRQRRPAFRQGIKALRQQRRAVFQLLQQEQLDAEALAQGFEQLRRAEEDLKALGHGAMVEVLPGLQLEQRREALAMFMRRGGAAPPHHKRPPPRPAQP